MNHSKSYPVWTIAEAKARLSEILRRAEQEGPQRIGARKAFVVVPEHTWQARTSQRKSMGKWLVENMPRGIDLEPPTRQDPGRELSFLVHDEK